MSSFSSSSCYASLVFNLGFQGVSLLSVQLNGQSTLELRLCLNACNSSEKALVLCCGSKTVNPAFRPFSSLPECLHSPGPFCITSSSHCLGINQEYVNSLEPLQSLITMYIQSQFGTCLPQPQLQARKVTASSKCSTMIISLLPVMRLDACSHCPQFQIM